MATGTTEREPVSPHTTATAALFARAHDDLAAAWPIRDGRLLRAADALDKGHVEQASRIAAKVLARYPGETDAFNLMAAIACHRGRLDEAEPLAARCVGEKPDNRMYRYNYALLLMRMGKMDEAQGEVGILLAVDSANPLFRNFRATLLCRKKQYTEASQLLRGLTGDYPDCPELWCMLASALRSMGGHTEGAETALRKATALAPWMGTVWWSLASLKTFKFSTADAGAMEAQLARPPASAQHRADMHFALGKAYEDLGDYEKSFQQYTRGNAIRRIDLRYDPDSTTQMVSRAKAMFTPELFREKSASGHDSAAPIFVLGLQRAGSTLTEQILGSHPQIDAAGELQSLIRIVGDDVMPKTGPDYPNGMDKLTADDLRAMGDKYLELSKPHRAHGRPFFVDKCPFNLWQVGLIHLIFPNAKIVDVRRHPIGCCLANFTMSFAHAPPLSYRLTDIGRFYRDYVELMAHFDRVLPGKIHRVIYEHLVADLEGEVRRLLDFLGLPFERACLEYYNNDRAFNSFSNEQVRRPIFSDAVERWRNYEPWLGPLKEALGPVLGAYPGVPEFGG